MMNEKARAPSHSSFIIPRSAFLLSSGSRDFDVAVNDTRERFLARGTDDSLGLAPAVEEDERRDALDAEALRHLLVLVNVELDELDLARVALGQLLERGRESAAGRAPLCPEVQNDGHVRLQD